MHHLWLKLKLKQRAVFTVAAAFILLLLFTQTSLLASLFNVGGPTPREWQGQWVDEGRQRFLQGLKNHRLQTNMQLERQYGVGGVAGGHLNMPRKDLDLSNYTSENDRRSHEGDPNNQLDLADKVYLSIKQAEDAVLKRILKDDTFKTKENMEKLLVAADFIKDTSKLGKLRLDEFKQVMNPQNFNGQRFLVRSGQTPADMMAEIKAREAAVGFGALEEYTLRKVKANQFYGTHSKKRKGIVLNLYDERSKNISSWQRFHSHISQFELYRSDDPVIDEVMYDLGHQEIVDCIMRGGGTQLKLIFYLANGARVLFKPMRFARTQETLPDHFYFSDYERHVAEIGAFYLDRVIGFNRVVPTAGRLINITHHIKRFAEHDLLKTFFVSPAGNICFHGVCDYYCDTGHAICGKPDLLEGSFAQYLPSSKRDAKYVDLDTSTEQFFGKKVDRKTWRHPWRRSYNKRKKASWETDNTYCDTVRTEAPYNEGRRLLDLMDMAVFDFLQGNLDRHHYETFDVFGNYTNPLHLDNGRGFGKAFWDEISILAPIYQCCLMRYSTMNKLLDFNHGPTKLSDAMRTAQSRDIVAPVVLEQHLLALDRRVKIILKTVYKCVQKNGSADKVVIDDGF